MSTITCSAYASTCIAANTAFLQRQQLAGMPLAGQDDMLCQADIAEIAIAGQSASMQL